MDLDFDFLCAHLFTGDFDQFPSFDFEDFDNTHVSVAPVEPMVFNDNSDSSALCSASLVGSKRGRDETNTENDVSMSSDEALSKQRKSEEEMKDKRLKSITDLINSLNQCENESFERLLREEYAEDVVLKINYMNQHTYHGRNALLLMWVATHEGYPDGMYKVLEKRYVNMTVPRGKSSISPVSCPKVEFVYKFSGTKIVPGKIVSLIRNFSEKHQDYATYSPEKLNDKLLQFLSTRELTFESECTENFIGEASLTFVPDTTRVKEVTFNVLAFDGSR